MRCFIIAGKRGPYDLLVVEVAEDTDEQSSVLETSGQVGAKCLETSRVPTQRSVLIHNSHSLGEFSTRPFIHLLVLLICKVRHYPPGLDSCHLLV